MMQNQKPKNDCFELYDLRIEVHHDGRRPMVCNHPEGVFFTARGENLHFQDGIPFPLYPLAALLPLLPVKQRVTSDYDWISTDSDVACPDPNCGGIFRIKRMDKRTFYHHQVTITPITSSQAKISENDQ